MLLQSTPQVYKYLAWSQKNGIKPITV